MDLEGFKGAIANLETIIDPTQVAKLSQDCYQFSPILRSKLMGKVGDLVVRPKTETDILQVAAACVEFKLPLIVRGAGTGNSGQCVPLQGGIILDMTQMNRILRIEPGQARVESGATLAAIDRQARAIGWELRTIPSTFRTATIGGFIAGGIGGLGSITYGLLAERGNLHALRAIALEDTPRSIEFRGDAVQQLKHAWGINGIITELEIPLAPAYPWAEAIVCFEDFMAAVRFGQALALADGLMKKLICVCAWPIPAYFAPLQSRIPEGSHCVLLMVSEACMESLQGLIQDHSGQICYGKSAEEASKGITLAEFSWNHTTLHARSVDPSLTYLQTTFPADPSLQLVEQLYHHFGNEVMMHLEFIRVNGVVVPAGLQIVRFTTEERLSEIIQYHQAQGISIANPHICCLEAGGHKQVDRSQLQFKQRMDPYGLLNPGKMRSESTM